MPSPLFADQSAGQPPERGMVEALITQTRQLRGEIDAVRPSGGTETASGGDAQVRWQHALCDLAAHQLDDLGEHLSQLREGLPAPEPTEPPTAASTTPREAAEPEPGSLLCRVGSAEWHLLTDEVSWSEELFEIFGRDRADGGLPLDELPSWVVAEDQQSLTAMLTDCLVDGKVIDGEFRIVRTDGRPRTVHIMGEPVLDADGGTASMWAVLRDVSELRRSQRAVRDSQDVLRRAQHRARTERRLAVQLQEAVLPPWRGPRQSPRGGPAGLDLAAHYLPSANSELIGGGWYDALPLPDGRAMLTVGDLTGHGVVATSGMATLLGALRGMAVAGVAPGPLMAGLNHLLDMSTQPSLGSAVCGTYDPTRRSLVWSQAGHPAPLLFRAGAGWVLPAPEGVLLGATSGASYGQAEELLEPGDVLVVHTDGLCSRHAAPASEPSGDECVRRLLRLAPRFTEARCAQECVRALVEEFGEEEREDDACLLVARVER